MKKLKVSINRLHRIFHLIPIHPDGISIFPRDGSLASVIKQFNVIPWLLIKLPSSWSSIRWADAGRLLERFPGALAARSRAYKRGWIFAGNRGAWSKKNEIKGVKREEQSTARDSAAKGATKGRLGWRRKRTRSLLWLGRERSGGISFRWPFASSTLEERIRFFRVIGVLPVDFRIFPCLVFEFASSHREPDARRWRVG